MRTNIPWDHLVLRGALGFLPWRLWGRDVMSWLLYPTIKFSRLCICQRIQNLFRKGSDDFPTWEIETLNKVDTVQNSKELFQFVTWPSPRPLWPPSPGWGSERSSPAPAWGVLYTATSGTLEILEEGESFILTFNFKLPSSQHFHLS